MTAVKEAQDLYFSHFAQLEKKLAANEPSWLQKVRKAAMDRFGELGFPTTHNEEWKYTSVAPIAKIPFRLATADVPAALSFWAPGAESVSGRLVFVNGHYSQELSYAGSTPARVGVGSLSAALAGEGSGSGLLEQHLARYAVFENHAFVALNTAFLEDGALIEIPRDVVLEKPIYLLYVSIANGQPAVSHPRNLILVGRGSQVSFIESYVGLNATPGTRNSAGSSNFDFRISSFEDEGVYFTNVVTEVVAGEGAVIDYCKVQQESERSFHVATLQFQQERTSSVTTHSIALGSALDREEITTVLGGEGAESLLHGLYVLNGRQHVDNHTTIDHAKPHCGSREVYKGVLDGKSAAVFNGKIIVRKDAQKTDSKQSNKNLLLSDDAVINTKPQLEIYADDVRCTHGATIGQIDPEAIFYLRSRGIARDDARSLLTQAFASDIIGKIKFEPLRERLKGVLLERLAKKPESEVE